LAPVSAGRHRLQAPFGAPVSGCKNPVPNSKKAGLRPAEFIEFLKELEKEGPDTE
jgi:hypothetical protein